MQKSTLAYAKDFIITAVGRGKTSSKMIDVLAEGTLTSKTSVVRAQLVVSHALTRGMDDVALVLSNSRPTYAECVCVCVVIANDSKAKKIHV